MVHVNYTNWQMAEITLNYKIVSAQYLCIKNFHDGSQTPLFLLTHITFHSHHEATKKTAAYTLDWFHDNNWC